MLVKISSSTLESKTTIEKVWTNGIRNWSLSMAPTRLIFLESLSRPSSSIPTSIPGLLVTSLAFPFDEVALAGSAAHQREILSICKNLNNGKSLSTVKDGIQGLSNTLSISTFRTRPSLRKMCSELLFKFLQIARISLWWAADPTRATLSTSRSRPGIEDGKGAQSWPSNCSKHFVSNLCLHH